MIKTVLVPASGSSADENVFATALAVARPLTAHLAFLHVQLSAGTAALHAPHVDFLQGAAVGTALAQLQHEQAGLARQAREHFRAFCEQHRVLIRDVPNPVELVSAHFAQENDRPLERLLQHTRHSDLTVLGRRRNRDCLPGGLIEELLAHGGRPLVIAGDQAPPRGLGTVVVGWKETPEAARAVTAAMPLLENARRVVLLGIREEAGTPREPLEDLAHQLAWHGINAEVAICGEPGGPAGEQLLATAARLQADLLVAGAFGHGAWRESVLGGVTRTLLEHADLAVLLMR